MEDLFPPQFWEVVRSKQREGQRYGQAVFNTMCEYHPEESRYLVGSHVDPFYRDERVEAFITNVVELATG